jgi:hypothetical protein
MVAQGSATHAPSISPLTNNVKTSGFGMLYTITEPPFSAGFNPFSER